MNKNKTITKQMKLLILAYYERLSFLKKIKSFIFDLDCLFHKTILFYWYLKLSSYYFKDNGHLWYYCQKPIVSHGVSQHNMHKITNLWKFELNWSSKLRDNYAIKNTLVTRICVISGA